jgi:hypothetical protein
MGADYLSLLFGLQGGEKIKDLRTSAEARARLAETLLYEHVGEPVLAMLYAVRRFELQLKGTVAIAAIKVRRAAEEAVHRQLTGLAGLLADDGTLAANILREEDVERLAAAIADAAAAQVQELTTAGDFGAALTLLRQLATDLANGDGKVEAIRRAIRAQIDARRAWIVAADPAQQVALFERLATDVASAALSAAVDSATVEVAHVIRVVSALAEKNFDAYVAIALDALTRTLDGAIALHDLARVSEYGRTIQGWCTDATDGAIAVVKALGHLVLSPQAAVDAAIGRIDSGIRAITPPASTPPAVLTRFEAIKSALLRTTQALATASAELAAARQRVDALTSAETCSSTASFARALERAVAERRQAMESLRGVARETGALARLVAEASGTGNDFKNAAQPHLDALVRDARALIAGLSVIGKAGLPGVWQDVIAPAHTRLEQTIGVERFQKQLRASYEQVTALAASIRPQLTAATAEQLSSIVEAALDVAEWDRRLTGLIVETVALGDQALATVKDVSLQLMKRAASGLLSLHTTAHKPLERLRDRIARYPIIKWVLEGYYEPFAQDVGKVEDETKLIANVAGSATFDEAAGNIGILRTAWQGNKPIALARAVGGVAAFIDAILKGRFAKLLGDRVGAEFAKLEREVREMIASFVPAKVTTRYDWNGKIGEPVRDPFGLFVFEMMPSTDQDIVLETQASFDFINNERTIAVTGKVNPFKITIPQMFVLTFNEASFRSVNGSDPKFRADLNNITLLESLQFLDALKALFAPSGNGFYLRPGLTGITVGYGFAKDLARVGSMTLSNIALDIYVTLPFGEEPTEFGFLFASPARPFLISNPPYGGGGWVNVRYRTNSSPAISLSFMFGAVTDIQFGPLRGQGRIVAGSGGTRILSAARMRSPPLSRLSAKAISPASRSAFGSGFT